MFSAKQLALAALMGVATADVQPIVMKGQALFYENGTQFYIKGVAYQRDTSSSEAAKRSTSSSDYIDPLADATRCKRDVPILAAAGTNVIRTYALDPTADHDECMSLLADAGIYVISDLSSPDQAINRASPVWDTALYTRYTSVIDAMKGYKNVIGFFGGNEVTNNASNTDASAFVKAAVRDTKAYINSTADRWMGVGYAANDDATIRDNMAHYFNCGDQESAIDFWGYNIYEWCGESTFQKSGYSEVVDFFSNFSVPVFFSEYGCNNDGAAARIFQETTELYSDDMTSVIAGGIVYMYFEEANDYGEFPASSPPRRRMRSLVLTLLCHRSGQRDQLQLRLHPQGLHLAQLSRERRHSHLRLHGRLLGDQLARCVPGRQLGLAGRQPPAPDPRR